MLGRDRIEFADESGTTMIELLVGLAMGMVVMSGLTMLLIVVLHGNARVDARVEATDNARIAVTKVMEELHSACTTHEIVPVKVGSTGTILAFSHAGTTSGKEAFEPEPVETLLVYNASSQTLSQFDYKKIGGTDLTPVFESHKAGNGVSRILLSKVSPGGPKGELFSYYSYGASGPTPVSTITSLTAPTVILVNVALTAGPRSTPVADAGANATVKDSASLRLTPPSSTGTEAQPCD
jgi:Tfp pilus assembly protein PilW